MHVISLVLFAMLSANSPAKPGAASDILQKSEQRVKSLEQLAENMSGTMKARVDFTSDILGKKSNGKSVYEIYVREGWVKAEVKTFSDFGSLQGGLPVLLRSEIQTIPNFLFVGIGSIRIIIEQSDFKLE